jgi:hypothetical protein
LRNKEIKKLKDKKNEKNKKDKKIKKLEKLVIAMTASLVVKPKLCFIYEPVKACTNISYKKLPKYKKIK